MVRFSKYEFYNKLLDGNITQSYTSYNLNSIIYIYIYVYIYIYISSYFLIDNNHINNNFGTQNSGYMTPMYTIERLFSVKSDVFSFGVILLKIISRKSNNGFYFAQHAPTYTPCICSFLYPLELTIFLHIISIGKKKKFYKTLLFKKLTGTETME